MCVWCVLFVVDFCDVIVDPTHRKKRSRVPRAVPSFSGHRNSVLLRCAMQNEASLSPVKNSESTVLKDGLHTNTLASEGKECSLRSWTLDLKSAVFWFVVYRKTARRHVASCEMDSGHWALRSLSSTGPFKSSCLVRTLKTL